MIIHIDICPLCGTSHDIYVQSRSAALGPKEKKIIVTCPVKNEDFTATIGDVKIR